MPVCLTYSVDTFIYILKRKNSETFTFSSQRESIDIRRLGFSPSLWSGGGDMYINSQIYIIRALPLLVRVSCHHLRRGKN